MTICISSVQLEVKEEKKKKNGCPNDLGVYVELAYEDFDGTPTDLDGRLYVNGNEFRKFTPSFQATEKDSGTKKIALTLNCVKESRGATKCVVDGTGSDKVDVQAKVWAFPCGQSDLQWIESNKVFGKKCKPDP